MINSEDDASLHSIEDSECFDDRLPGGLYHHRLMIACEVNRVPPKREGGRAATQKVWSMKVPVEGRSIVESALDTLPDGTSPFNSYLSSSSPRNTDLSYSSRAPCGGEVGGDHLMATEAAGSVGDKPWRSEKGGRNMSDSTENSYGVGNGSSRTTVAVPVSKPRRSSPTPLAFSPLMAPHRTLGATTSKDTSPTFRYQRRQLREPEPAKERPVEPAIRQPLIPHKPSSTLSSKDVLSNLSSDNQLQSVSGQSFTSSPRLLNETLALNAQTSEGSGGWRLKRARRVTPSTSVTDTSSTAASSGNTPGEKTTVLRPFNQAQIRSSPKQLGQKQANPEPSIVEPVARETDRTSQSCIEFHASLKQTIFKPSLVNTKFNATTTTTTTTTTISTGARRGTTQSRPLANKGGNTRAHQPLLPTTPPYRSIDQQPRGSRPQANRSLRHHHLPDEPSLGKAAVSSSELLPQCTPINSPVVASRKVRNFIERNSRNGPRETLERFIEENMSPFAGPALFVKPSPTKFNTHHHGGGGCVSAKANNASSPLWANLTGMRNQYNMVASPTFMPLSATASAPSDPRAPTKSPNHCTHGCSGLRDLSPGLSPHPFSALAVSLPKFYSPSGEQDSRAKGKPAGSLSHNCHIEKGVSYQSNHIRESFSPLSLNSESTRASASPAYSSIKRPRWTHDCTCDFFTPDEAQYCLATTHANIPVFYSSPKYGTVPPK